MAHPPDPDHPYMPSELGPIENNQAPPQYQQAMQQPIPFGGPALQPNGPNPVPIPFGGPVSQPHPVRFVRQAIEPNPENIRHLLAFAQFMQTAFASPGVCAAGYPWRPVAGGVRCGYCPGPDIHLITYAELARFFDGRREDGSPQVEMRRLGSLDLNEIDIGLDGQVTTEPF
ncbi:hypothetical protein LTS12_014764 [Elasticomyces elasticus]|nr:hypothetical protein LTS12_014764 [Elasticomyces elasticus]